MFAKIEAISFRIARWAALGLVVALAAIGSSKEATPPAFAAGLTPEFSIAVSQNGVPIKEDCFSFPTTVAGKCLIHPGTTFQVEVYLDKLPPGLPDGDDPDALGGYTAIGLRLDHSQNLTFEAGSEVWGWPDCGSFFDDSEDVGLVNLACLNGAENASTYQSGFDPVVTMDFTCPNTKTTETITLTYGTEGDKIDALVLPYDTVVVDEALTNLTQSGPSETLVINCNNFFPWDLNGDGSVSAPDIFIEISHFNETKSTP
jgi:hypothetical protein